MAASGPPDSRPPSTSDVDALESAVEESRREYDKKVASMEEIDDKAMRSVRTAVVVSGFVASAVGIGGPGAVGNVSLLPMVFGATGVALLAVVIVGGIGVYSVTEYPSGIGPSHRTDVITGGYEYAEWLVDLLNEYSRWSHEIESEIARNQFYLEVVQFSLLCSVLSLLTSSGMIVFQTAYGVSPSVTFVIGLLLLFAFGSVAQNVLTRDAQTDE